MINHRFVSKLLLPLMTLFIASCLLSANTSALTVAEVAKDLACPCQCPLILEDCNMSCGLQWKNEIGELILEGKTKQEIMDHFINRHGENARLTFRQKIDGKVYQYTRGFETQDWLVLWSGFGLWVIILFLAIYFIIRKLIFAKT